jgi:hypothetical protein
MKAERRVECWEGMTVQREGNSSETSLV